jgi:hypothetical protein
MLTGQSVQADVACPYKTCGMSVQDTWQVRTGHVAGSVQDMWQVRTGHVAAPGDDTCQADLDF